MVRVLLLIIVGVALATVVAAALRSERGAETLRKVRGRGEAADNGRADVLPEELRVEAPV